MQTISVPPEEALRNEESSQKLFKQNNHHKSFYEKYKAASSTRENWMIIVSNIYYTIYLIFKPNIYINYEILTKFDWFVSMFIYHNICVIAKHNISFA